MGDLNFSDYPERRGQASANVKPSSYSLVQINASVAATGPGLVTSSGTALSSTAFPGGTTLFLRADGTFASPGAASMVYPGAGVAVSTGTAWGASLTLATVATSGAYADLSGRPALVTIATSGSAADLSAGTVPAARMPAHTGDVTSPSGSVALTIAAAAVTLSKMANLAANSILGNNTGSAATPIALTAVQTKALLAVTATDVSGLATVATTGSAADLTGNLAVGRLNGGTGATSSTFWRGDGSWTTPAGAGGVTIFNDNATAGPVYPLCYTGTGATSTLYQSDGGLAYYPSRGGLRPNVLELPAASTADIAPPGGNVGQIYSKLWAFRTVPTFRNPSLVMPLQYDLSRWNVRQLRFGATTAVATMASILGAMPYTATGTASIKVPTVTQPWLGNVMATAAAANSITTVRMTTANVGCVVIGTPFFFSAQFGINTVATSGDVRLFVGLYDTNAIPTVIIPVGGAGGSTTPGRMGICAYTQNTPMSMVNTRSGVTPTASGLPTVGSYYDLLNVTKWEVAIWSDGVNIYWQTGVLTTNGEFSNIVSGTFSSNVPVSGTIMYPALWLSNGATASVHSAEWFSVTLGTPY